MVVGGVHLLGFSFILFSLCSTELGSAQQSKNRDASRDRIRKEPKQLQCYDCNSEYDSRCSDPFDPYTIGVINCSDKKPPENLLSPDLPYPKPTVCRKTVQKVEGRKRVIRECGYIQDDRDDKACIRRTGTKDIEMEYCSCTTSLCNASEDLRPFTPLFLAFSVLGVFILLF